MPGPRSTRKTRPSSTRSEQSKRRNGFPGNPDAPGRRRLNKPASPALRKQKAVVSQHLPILRQPGDRGAFADSGGTAKEHPPSLAHRQRTVAEQKFPREEFRKQSEKEEHPRRPAEPHRRIRLSGQETADQTGLRVDRRIQVAAAAVYPPGRNRQTGKKFTAAHLRHRSAAFRQTGCGTEKFEQPAGGGPFRTQRQRRPPPNGSSSHVSAATGGTERTVAPCFNSGLLSPEEYKSGQTENQSGGAEIFSILRSPADGGGT